MRRPLRLTNGISRQRLDVFPILQFLAVPSDQRAGFRGYSLRLITWITLVAMPVLILLQGQVSFLPYHREWIVWLQRVTVLIDLALIWYFWIHLRSDDDSSKWGVRKAWIYLGGGAGTLCVVIFSTYLATFPGELMKAYLPEPSSLLALLFEGRVDTVSGRPRGNVFSNRLALTDQSFVVDPEKLDKVAASRPFRDGDFRLAVLNRANLRKADFAGAQLQGAELRGAQLQGASLDGAQLQGASLDGAQLQGASLDGAQLQGASLDGSRLQDAGLVNVLVWRASGIPNLDLADFPNIDAQQKPWKDDEAFASWRDEIANSVPAGRLRDRMIEHLAVLDPTGKEPKDALAQAYWDRAQSSQPRGEEVRRKRVMFLADLACQEHLAPYVTRGVLRNWELKG